MGYQQGLSGLAASSNDLDVIGNNIANANTVGFKQSAAQFADVYANTIASSVNTQIGLGAALSEVQQNFSQGTITTTGQALDMAINGNGFYQMSNNGTVTYSRNGVFQLDKNGYITDAAGNDLMGYAAGTNGVVNSAQTVPLQVPTTNIAPVTTSTITAQLNLNAQSTAPSATPFDATNSDTYNYSTSITAYDSLGGTQQVNMYFVKNSTSGNWDVYAGTAGNVSSTPVGSMKFDSSGTLTNTYDSTGASTTLGSIGITINPTDGSATNQAINLNFAGTTQYGSTNGVNNLAQDGYASGTLSNFTVGSDGTITGNYSNGQTKTLGQVVLANFNNPNGLQNLGGNQFQETAASGVAQVSTPGSTNHGTITGGAVESSNVDLTNQLVDLITAQRNYQANAQTIKTQQTVDQTLLQM
ncbi:MULTISPECIES: flagellar hook protein FlgE [unclassified Paraburkholderia]|uniref:flagellar hook protein FlgE n=1 Tax=unclassified Paraburkholderia TaxID=2615204 RepID=UPI001980B92A|nr:MULTISPECIES: flagellar hook protein FlgE [unclassified Paraburkholderia]MBN3858203.1 flagellar hook protein FlgE [Paraburkholderia sp. Ac-20340]